MEGEQKRHGCSPRSKKKVSFAEEKALKAQTALEAAKRRETVKETLRQKFEFEQKALSIVERLLDDEVADDFLIDCARFIIPSNYGDTVEERSILKMCGYPVCPNKLHNMPKQQFRISTQTNKVYDITERKCFCSNFCYKASKHFEVQISKTPLWLREEERPPNVKLLKKGESGSSGEEVKILAWPISESEIENPEPAGCARSKDLSASGSESEGSDQEQDFVSSVVTGGGAGPERGAGHESGTRVPKHRGEGERNGAKARAAERDREKDIDTALEHAAEPAGAEDGDERPESDEHKCGNEPQQPHAEADEGGARTRAVTDRPEETAEASADLLSACRTGETDTRAGNGAEAEPGLNITQVGVSRRGAADLRSLLNAWGKDPAAAVRADLLERLSRTLREWRTEATLAFLHRPACTTPEEDGEELDEDDLEESGDTPASQVRPSGGRGKVSAPAPDYDTLRKETDQLNLRIQEFYRGARVLPEEEKTHPEDTSGWDPALPLVDSHSQNVIQKRIVSEKLNRSLRDIVGPLKLSMNDISTHLNNLIRTLRFTNANIIHKSPEWTLLAVVLLSVLSDVTPVLQESLERPSSMQYISTLMGELMLTDRDLQRLVQLFRVHSK
ncbi:hypothetical protein SKAU_G00203300 [Synaphobranchus kaupii]|uniref:RNA polymerase II subunit B1 CTD phosphatase RPAP2 homolog n=1 Tax=Synaphobranchus kaupii TaxID=118154 RepID=A0A9Q1IY21_SYNKA|nr:hypothetical protein SKAU_G00203300 [Synaphobranchus kaupii]